MEFRIIGFRETSSAKKLGLSKGMRTAANTLKFLLHFLDKFIQTTWETTLFCSQYHILAIAPQYQIFVPQSQYEAHPMKVFAKDFEHLSLEILHWLQPL